jgi:hypothetical protein
MVCRLVAYAVLSMNSLILYVAPGPQVDATPNYELTDRARTGVAVQVE